MRFFKKASLFKGDCKMDDNEEFGQTLADGTTSRRAVLKAAGVAAVGTLLSATTSGIASAQDKTIHGQTGTTVVPPPLIESAIKIAIESPLVKREIDQLQQADLIFDLSTTAVKQSSSLGDVVGLLLETIKTPSPRLGANLLITADPKTNRLLSLQYVISWSLLHALEIESVVFNASDPLEIDLSGPGRGSADPRIVRPHIEQHWSFPRAEAIPARPEEMVESGWPPESPDFPRWYFDGSAAADWMQVANTPLYAVKTVTEVFSDGSRQAPPIELQYPMRICHR